MIRRNHIRRTLLRLEARHPEHKEAICKILSDENLLGQAVDKVKADLGDPPPNFPILDWLWNNRQRIIQIILAIIALLATGS